MNNMLKQLLAQPNTDSMANQVLAIANNQELTEQQKLKQLDELEKTAKPNEKAIFEEIGETLVLQRNMAKS